MTRSCGGVEYPELLERLRKALRPLTPVVIPVSEAVGYVVSDDVKALRDVPSIDEAFMDGYAVRAPLRAGEILRVLENPEGGLGPGEALRVRCGDHLPEGADSVLPLEYAEVCESSVKALKHIHPGYGVRFRGQDVRAGEVLASRGHVLRPETVKALIDSGIDRVKAYPKPRVALFPTGNEFVSCGTPEFTGRLIADLIRGLGAEVSYLNPLPDDEAVIADAVSKALRVHDAAVIIGGSGPSWMDRSWRAGDLIGGINEVFHGIKLMPGRTSSMYLIGNKPVINLPGFPTAAYTSALLVAAPAIHGLMGLPIRPALSPLRVARLIGNSLSNTSDCLRIYFLRSHGLRYVSPLMHETHSYRVLLDSDAITLLGSGGKVSDGGLVVAFSKHPHLI